MSKIMTAFFVMSPSALHFCQEPFAFYRSGLKPVLLSFSSSAFRPRMLGVFFAQVGTVKTFANGLVFNLNRNILP